MDDSARAGSSSGSSETWLHDDHRILIYTLVGLALAIGGHRTWQEYHRHKENAARRARILRLVENSRREKEKEQKLRSEAVIDSADGMRKSAEVPPPAVAVTSNQSEPEAHAEALHQTLSASTSDLHAPSGSESAGAIKRPKERRKRGRDVYKEVLKQERKKVAVSPATAKAPAPASSSSFLQVQSTSGSDADASRSRSRSVSPSRIRTVPVPVSEYDSTEDTPRPKAAEWGGQAAPTHTHDVDHDGRSDYSSMSDSLSSLGAGTHGSGTSHTSPSASVSMGLGNPNERGSTEAGANVTNNYKPRTPPLTRSGPSSTASESISSVSVDAGSPPISLNLDLIVEDGESSSSPTHGAISISQPVPSALPAKTQPPWLPSPHVARQHPKTHPKTGSSSSVASFANSDASVGSGWDGGSFVQPRRRLSKSPPPPPRFRSLSRVSSASVSPLPFANNTLLQDPEAGAGTSFSSTPPPLPASYRNALEQARRREEAYRREAERFRQECDVLRLRWNEDAELARRREADLQAQLQQVTAQMQTLSMTVSQMQMQSFIPYSQQQQMHQPPQSRPGFPVHPPLHSATTMPIPGPYGYLPPNYISSPGPVPGGVPYPFPMITNLPHMTPRSASGSASGKAENGSPTREYALGAFDVASPSPQGGRERGDSLRSRSGDEVSEELAEAILRRPESMRSPAAASTSGFSFGTACEAGHDDGAGSNRGGSRSASVVGRATRDGFTFASLSELGNPQPQPGSRRTSLNGQEGDGEGDYEWDGADGDTLQNSEAVDVVETPDIQPSSEATANHENLDTTKSDGDFTLVLCHSELRPTGDGEDGISDNITDGALDEGASAIVA